MNDKQLVPISAIAPNPDQPRKYFDEDALARLGRSLEKRQNQPVTVVPHPQAAGKVKWMIVDGERRWRAAKAIGMTEMWIVVDGDVETAEAVHEASFAANWCREGHTHRETAEAIDLLVQQGKTYEEIAAMVGKSESWAQKEHQLLKLADEVLALVDPPTPKTERIPIAAAYALTAYPPHKQLSVWRKNRAVGAKAAFHHIRTQAPRQSSRSRGDDVRYIKAQASSLESVMKRLQVMPAAMLRSLSQKDREEVAARLSAGATRAKAMADLLLATAAEGEGEE